METSEAGTNDSLLTLSQSLAAAVERAGACVVAINARPRVPTSGVHWRQGLVVSTNHTVRRDEEITVVLPSGRTVPATLVGRDPSTDLAVLRIEDEAARETEVAEISDPAEVKAGHLVLAVGRVSEKGTHPRPMVSPPWEDINAIRKAVRAAIEHTTREHEWAEGLILSASFGIVSAAGGAWRTWRGGEIDRLLRLDVAIFLGFSGGALVDTRGRVLGINTSAMSRGAGLAIPASTVNRVVSTLSEKGFIPRGYLGVGRMMQVGLPQSLQRQLNLPGPSGLIILSVEPDGPAAQGGMLMGDVLVALDDAPTRDSGDVQRFLGAERVGQTLKATVVRGGARVELTITVGERPLRGR